MASHFCRFTPQSPTDYTLDIVFDHLKELCTAFIVSYETDANRPHFHFALWNTQYSTETLRARLKRVLHGQLYISGKDIENKINAIAYIIKDGLFRSFNVDAVAYLSACQVTQKKVKYDDLVKEIEIEYNKSLINDRQLIGKLLDSAVKCNRKIYLNHIKAQALLIKLKKETNKDKREFLIDKIIDDI